MNIRVRQVRSQSISESVISLPSKLSSTNLEYKWNKTFYLGTESEIITGKSRTETLMYWQSDSLANSKTEVWDSCNG